MTSGDLRVQSRPAGGKPEARPVWCHIRKEQWRGEPGSFSLTQVSIITSSLTMNLTALCNSSLPVSTLSTFHTKWNPVKSARRIFAESWIVAALICLLGGNIKVNIVTRILSLQTFQVHSVPMSGETQYGARERERERECCETIYWWLVWPVDFSWLVFLPSSWSALPGPTESLTWAQPSQHMMTTLAWAGPGSSPRWRRALGVLVWDGKRSRKGRYNC